MTIGIICEYNPFHNGHLYHLNKIKEKYKDSTIILIMSGNYVQRGNISILNKWDKTKIALSYGIDLIIELPFIFATQSADIFAKGAISILKELKVDKLIFGSESNNKNKLEELAQIQLNNKDYNNLVKSYLDKGLNYPSAMNKALNHITKQEIKHPNDLLGLSYIKQIIIQKANIEIETIKRTNDFHSTKLTTNITSATSIRTALKNKIDITNYVPKETLHYLNKTENSNTYFNYLKYKILSNPTNLPLYQTVDEGIENRILKYINSCQNLDELISKVKTKRYTYNKISRMMNHILCNFTKEEAISQELNYIRLLGFSKKGQNYLNKIKKDLTIPLITKQKKEFDKLLSIDNRCDDIYDLITNSNTKNHPIIKQNK